jgi:GFO/IDH/MocA oxidoreductase family protein
MKSKINRRGFMTASAATGAFTIVPRHVLGGAAFVPPSDKLTLAHVGMGTQSVREMEPLLSNPQIQIVSVCDPNRDSDDYVEWGKGNIRKRIQTLLGNSSWRANQGGCPGGREVGREIIDTYYANQRGAAKFKGVSVYADFREMLEKETGVDAVKVMTPDHLHATVAIAAMKKGKHVVMHKPIANRLQEARLTLATNRETKTQTHLLAFGSGLANAKLAAEVKKGVIGKLREIHNWTNRPVWTQYTEIPTDYPPIPEGFDWDLWLGPALYRPFHPNYTHTVYRGWYDFGGGSMADMGIYSLLPVFNTLELDSAISAQAYATHTCATIENVSRPAKNDVAYPTGCQLRFRFAAKAGMPELDLFWYDGGMKPRLPGMIEAEDVQMGREGILFVGDKGCVMADFRGQNPRLYTGSASSKPLFGEPEEKRGYADRTGVWVKSFMTGQTSPGSFLYTGEISDTVNLGTIALRTGEKVLFDPKAMRITNNTEANKLLSREYRPGWEL